MRGGHVLRYSNKETLGYTGYIAYDTRHSTIYQSEMFLTSYVIGLYRIESVTVSGGERRRGRHGAQVERVISCQ